MRVRVHLKVHLQVTSALQKVQRVHLAKVHLFIHLKVYLKVHHIKGNLFTYKCV